MNATAATRQRRTEGVAKIVKASVDVAVPHALQSSSHKLASKLEPAQSMLEFLPQDLQDQISSYMETMLNLFDDVKKKEVGISKFNKTENENNLNIPTCLKSMKNPLISSEAVKTTETYEQLETWMDTLLQNYKVQLTKIILEVTNFEVEQNKKKLISAMND